MAQGSEKSRGCTCLIQWLKKSQGIQLLSALHLAFLHVKITWGWLPSWSSDNLQGYKLSHSCPVGNREYQDPSICSWHAQSIAGLRGWNALIGLAQVVSLKLGLGWNHSRNSKDQILHGKYGLLKRGQGPLEKELGKWTIQRRPTNVLRISREEKESIGKGINHHKKDWKKESL